MRWTVIITALGPCQKKRQTTNQVLHVWINALLFCICFLLQVTTQTENCDFQTPDEMDFSEITGSDLMDSAPPIEKELSVCEMVISGSITLVKNTLFCMRKVLRVLIYFIVCKLNKFYFFISDQ